MQIITESTAPVTIQEAKVKASLYATAWGVPEVTLTLHEKFAIVEAADDKKEKVVFALDWKTQKLNNTTSSKIQAYKSNGEVVDLEVTVWDDIDVTDFPLSHKIFNVTLGESKIFLEGSLSKVRRTAKSVGAAYAASIGKSSLSIKLTECIATIKNYETKVTRDAAAFLMESTVNGAVLCKSSGMNKETVTAIANRNIIGDILDTVLTEAMSTQEKDKSENIVKGMKSNISDFRKRYGSDAKSVMYATANKLAQQESVEEDAAYETWQNQVMSANPELKDKIKFINKNDHNGSLIVSAQVGDRSLGVFDIEGNEGELLGESVIPAKNVIGSFRTSAGKTFIYGSTKNKWAIKHGFEHEIESGSKLEQNKFGTVKGNVLTVAVGEESDGKPKTEKWNIRHVWKNEQKQDLDESALSFTIEYEIKDAQKTTSGKVSMTGKDANEAKQRFMQDHQGEGQINVKSVTQNVSEELSVTDSAIGVTGGSDSAYVVYTDKSGRKLKKLKHGTSESIRTELEEAGCTVHSIKNGNAAKRVSEGRKSLSEARTTDVQSIVIGALDDAYAIAQKAKVQYDTNYTDPDDEPFDMKDALADAYQEILQSIIDELDSAKDDYTDKVDGYLSGKNVDEEVEVVIEAVKTRQEKLASMITNIYGGR